MALHLLEVPEMRCTINLVPSLLLQIQAYADGHRDRSPARGHAACHRQRISAEEDAEYILDNFFMANPDHVIRPWPRSPTNCCCVADSAGPRRPRTPEAVQRSRSARSAGSLQPGVDPSAGVRARQRSPGTPREGAFLFRERQAGRRSRSIREILRQIIPLHRRLQDHGQVELTTTPFYHPIPAAPLRQEAGPGKRCREVKLPR